MQVLPQSTRPHEIRPGRIVIWQQPCHGQSQDPAKQPKRHDGLLSGHRLSHRFEIENVKIYILSHHTSGETGMLKKNPQAGAFSANFKPSIL